MILLPYRFIDYQLFRLMKCIAFHRVASGQIRDCEVQEDTDADMEVIKHRIYLNHPVFSVCDDADNISLQFGFVLFWDERLSSLGEKDDIYVELRVDIWNRGGNFRRELNMPLRWSRRLDASRFY